MLGIKYREAGDTPDARIAAEHRTSAQAGKGATDAERASLPEGTEAAVLLQGRRVSRMAAPVIGASILELARRNKVDWMSSCNRGTCARCRCLVSEGMEHLTVPGKAELDRLSPEEIAQGYRLGCQVKIASYGAVVVKNVPYS
jgi:2Fe-2S ferredoxin